MRGKSLRVKSVPEKMYSSGGFGAWIQTDATNITAQFSLIENEPKHISQLQLADIVHGPSFIRGESH